MSFDRIAPHYRWMEFLLAGEKLQRCRTAFLPEVKSPSRILLMGEGHGRFLEICSRQFPSAEITVVDASLGMLNAARLHCAETAGNKIRFVHRDCLNWDPGSQTFDLIATHFFLDCFPPDELSSVISKLTGVLNDGGAWLISDFRVPERGISRARARMIHSFMYAFFRTVTRLPATRLTCPDPYLAGNGLRLEQRREWEWGLLHSDLWRRA